MNAYPYITLSQLTASIQHAIRDTFARQSFWVVADVTSHSWYPAKGYHYFDLVEKDAHTHQLTAKVQATAWGNGATRIREFESATGQRFGNDMHVLVKVAVDYHPVYGLKLSLLDIDTSFTIGLLEQQKQATLQRLLAECGDLVRKTADGYLTRNKQLPLNPVIQRIAVISSSSSAGYQDFMHTLGNNVYGYTFFTDNYFSTVQGEANAGQVCAQLDAVAASGRQYDTVVIIRGGGAQTDLLIFDQFLLGKAIAGFPVPVITGIGHLKNETIADMLAHTAVKTPTKAAELIIAHNRAFEEALLSAQQNMIIRLQQTLSANRQGLSYLHANIINRSRDLLQRQRAGMAQLSGQLLSRPVLILANRLQELEHIRRNTALFARRLLQQQQQYLQHHDAMIRVMSPDALLRKGFAIVHHNGKIAVSAAGIKAGDTIAVQLADATLHAGVTTKTLTDGNEPHI